MIVKSGNVNVGFQKILTGVNEVKSFGNWHCVLAGINSSGFGMNGLCRKLLKTRRARLSGMWLFCDRICAPVPSNSYEKLFFARGDR